MKYINTNFTNSSSSSSIICLIDFSIFIDIGIYIKLDEQKK